MPTDINPVFLQWNPVAMPPEFRAYAIVRLMSHYRAAPKETSWRTELASIIDRHLKVLADAPPPSRLLRATCQELSKQWGAVA
ncbi:MAG: hypothetical protein WA191_02820 [Telluria sp.]